MAILNTNEMMFTAFEPKLQNRFLMFIDGIPAYLIKKIARPSITFGEVVLDHINVKRKIKGKANWENITCDLYDPVTPSGAQAVMEWVRLSHESVTGRDGYSDFYKKACCQNATFGDMDWTSDTPANISMTIVMDYAILNY